MLIKALTEILMRASIKHVCTELYNCGSKRLHVSAARLRVAFAHALPCSKSCAHLSKHKNTRQLNEAHYRLDTCEDHKAQRVTQQQRWPLPLSTQPTDSSSSSYRGAGVLRGGLG